ncbi:MAG TPA: LamG-like jellyroll fold domain-containing protein, partial [Gemmataceae bacterium]|nr:LamG-like jellyroll fold domain-containing protein [Gemmataceae bacterium]
MFDPYHKWLGIPKDQRPPTYYQLLGITQGEEDIEVIEEAAIRQTTHVRAYQIGAHAKECTQLLNEISQARTTLTNPAKRKQYDATLPQKKERSVTQVTASPPPESKAAPMFADLDDATELMPATKPVARPAAAARSSKGMLYLAAGGGGVLVLAIILIVALSGGKPDDQHAHNGDKGKTKEKVNQKKNEIKNNKKDGIVKGNKEKINKEKVNDDKKGAIGKQEDKELAAKVVGRYTLSYSGEGFNQKGKTRWQFTDDHRALENGNPKGSWQAEDGKVMVVYSQAFFGQAVLQFQDDNRLTGKHRQTNGQVFNWTLEREGVAAAQPVLRWNFSNNSPVDSIRGLKGNLHGGAKIVNGRLRLDGKKPSCLVTELLPVDLGARTLEVWLTLADLAQGDSGVVQLVDNRGWWDGIFYATKKPRNWYPGSSYNHRSSVLEGPAEEAAPGELVQIVAVYRADNSITLYRNGKVYGETFRPTGQSSELQIYKKEDAFLVMGSNGGSLQFFKGDIAEVRVYDTPLNEQEVDNLFRTGRPTSQEVAKGTANGLVVKEEVDCSQPPRLEVDKNFRLDKDWSLSFQYMVPDLEKERLLILWGETPSKKSPLSVQQLGKFINVRLSDATNPREWTASQVAMTPDMVGKWIRIKYVQNYSTRTMLLDLGEGAKNNWILGFTPKQDGPAPFWIGGDPGSPRFPGRIRNLQLGNFGAGIAKPPNKEKVEPIVAGPSPLDKLDPDKIAPQDRLEKIPELVAVLKGPKSEIFGVAFSPDSKKVACACNDGELYYWDLGEGKVEAGLPLGPMGGAIAALAFSADGKRLACANQAQARIYDLKPPQPKGIREIPLKV